MLTHRDGLFFEQVVAIEEDMIIKFSSPDMTFEAYFTPGSTVVGEVIE